MSVAQRVPWLVCPRTGAWGVVGCFGWHIMTQPVIMPERDASEPGEMAAALEQLHARVHSAAKASGREPSNVRILAVSKQQPTEAIAAAYEAGQRDFGENYAQELARKSEALRHLADVRWHFIGHLQRNKVRDIIGRAAVVHTVDRVELVTELERRQGARGDRLDVLVQVNMGGEVQKGGCKPDELATVLDAVARAEHLRATGLMTLPPFDDDPERSRPHFAALRELRARHGGAAALPELSMGMSGDFEVAVSEGATIVRLGTALFGARQRR